MTSWREAAWSAWFAWHRTRRRIRPELYNFKSLQTAFIVSTGRTATKFFARLLDEHFEGVAARHEPAPDLFALGTAVARGAVEPAAAQRRLRDSRLHVIASLRKAGAVYYIESNNNLAYLLPQLRQMFPKSPIIHLLRDGRDFVRSSYSKTVRLPGPRKRQVLFMSPQDHRRRLMAVDLADDPFCAQWGNMDRFARMCWYWATKDGMIRDVLENDPYAVTVRFEDAFNRAADYPGIWRIINFLKLGDRLRTSKDELRKRLSAKENRTQQYLLPHWEEWTPEQAETFERIAGAHMDRLGYAR